MFLPGKSHGWRSLVGYNPWGRKELDMTEWLHFHFFTFQYSCRDNPMDKIPWSATVHRMAKSWTRLSTHTHGDEKVSNIKLLNKHIWARRREVGGWVWARRKSLPHTQGQGLLLLWLSTQCATKFKYDLIHLEFRVYTNLHAWLGVSVYRNLCVQSVKRVISFMWRGIWLWRNVLREG